MKNSRGIAITILKEIEEGAYSNLRIDYYLRGVADKRDRGLITELVYGVLRQRNRLDYIIKSLSTRPIEKLDLPVLLSLRVGLYQLIFLDRIPARAAVNETINALKGKVNKGALGYTNGLLRGFLRKADSIEYPQPENDQSLYLSIFHSHPYWLIKYWLKQYGYSDTLRLCQDNNQAAELTIRRNTLKCSREELMAKVNEKNITIDSTGVPDSYRLKHINSVSELPYYREGGFIVQGTAATLAGLLLNPEPGMRVLDMAAAPGGKTTHLAELMNNQGEIIALDIHQHKLRLIEDNCKKMGIDIVKTICTDSSKFRTNVKFDMILLDAPCSGLGLIRQKPEIRWNKKPEDIKLLSDIQLKMFKRAIELVERNGHIMYSTCTLTAEENQDIIQKILVEYSNEVQLLDLNEELTRLGLNTHFTTRQMDYLELFPPDSRTEGFFIAKLKKK